MERLAGEIEPQVVQLRGLPFLQDVEKIFQTPDELRRVLKREIDRMYPGETLQAIEKRLLKFGFVVGPIDLRQLLMQLLSQQIAGYYDPIEKKMVLIEGPWDLEGTPVIQIMSTLIIQQLGLSIDKILLAHELTHVIQDQHFDLMGLPIEDLTQEDQALAVRALIEGDATLVMMDFILQQQQSAIDTTRVPGITDNMRFWTSSPFMRSLTMFQQVPRYLMDNLLFSYIDGFEFVLELKQHGGWEAINQAYRDIPVSTEQILHPEKYFVERDPPTMIHFATFAEIFAGWQELEQNTLGEFNIQRLIDSYLPVERARVASEGWDGDRFVVYEHPETDQLVLAWYTTWDSEQDSREFFHIYADVLEKRYAKPADAEGSPSEDMPARSRNQQTWDPPGEKVFIEIRGKDVLILDGIPEALYQEAVQHLWNTTKR
jgi:hypothetical protein